MSESKQTDGGPAFPRTGEGFGNPKYDAPGMTLRDWFAGQALPAVVKQYAESNGGIGHDHLPANCAIHTYRIADAMLAARSKVEG